MNHIDSADALVPGDVIEGRWRIEKVLGRGGMAVVYEAQHLSLDRRAALKVLDLHGNTNDLARMRERFEREAKLAAKITHPNIVTIYDHGFVEKIGQPYIAMEYLDGHDLEVELQRNGAMNPMRALNLFDGALGALGKAHADGIVHKDLKPSNLFLVEPGTRSERLVILDFGIAGVRDDPNGRLTRTHEYAGTPAYAAPEYIEHQLVTPALDVYQMGLILGEVLTGAPVVQASTPMSYMMAHCQGRTDVHPSIASSPLGPVLQKALALDHTKRTPHAESLRDALAYVDPASVPNLAGITGAGMLQRPPSLPQATNPMAPPPLAAPGPQTTHVSSSKSVMPLVVVAAGVLFALVLVGGGAVFLAAQALAGGDSEQAAESASSSSSGNDSLGSSSPPVFSLTPSIPSVGVLKSGHLAASMVVAPLDNSIALFLGFWEQYDGDPETVQGAAPSDGMKTLFEHGIGHLETVEGAGGDLGASAKALAELMPRMREVFVDLDDYYHVSKGYKDDGNAQGKVLKQRLEALYVDYQKRRDVYVAELVKASAADLEKRRASASPAQASLYDVMLASGDLTLAIMGDPASKETDDAIARFKSTYSESRKLIASDSNLDTPAGELREIMEAVTEFVEERDEIVKNKKLSKSNKMHKLTSERTWTVTHYFWLTRGFF